MPAERGGQPLRRNGIGRANRRILRGCGRVRCGAMGAALIVIDMLNHYEHEDAEPLMASVADALPTLRELIDKASGAGLLTVYVNDNHGDWSAGREKIVKRALEGAGPS